MQTWVLEEALKQGQLVSEAPPPIISRPKITYSPGEPEGYKNFKWGMTFEETREFYHLKGDLGRKYNLAFSRDQAELNLPFEDSIGPVRVTVSLTFLPSARLGPESSVWEPEKTLSSVYISFQSKDYETLKEILIERYGKPGSSRHEPYQTQGGAKSTNEILMWKGAYSFINLSRFGNRITEGSALMGTNEALQALSKKKDEAIKGAAKGL